MQAYHRKNKNPNYLAQERKDTTNCSNDVSEMAISIALCILRKIDVKWNVYIS